MTYMTLIFFVLFGSFDWSISITENVAHQNFKSSIEFSQKTNNSTGNNTHDLNSVQITIIGGNYRQQYNPWLIYLSLNGRICGGTLIELDLVLTVAQCLVQESGKPIMPEQIIAIAGVRDLEISQYQTIRASGIKIHENFYRKFLQNDIALIRLGANFNTTEYVFPIAYESAKYNGTAISGTIAGWGATWIGGPPTAILREINVQIITGNICDTEMTFKRGQFCAGGYQQGFCKGDIGAPFICDNQLDMVCGIASYGDVCELTDKPNVYTNVTHYAEWIMNNRFIDGPDNDWHDSSSTRLFISENMILFVSLSLGFVRLNTL